MALEMGDVDTNREEPPMAGVKRPSFTKRLKEQKRLARAAEKRDARRSRRAAERAEVAAPEPADNPPETPLDTPAVTSPPEED